jgi:hypothetical protein
MERAVHVFGTHRRLRPLNLLVTSKCPQIDHLAGRRVGFRRLERETFVRRLIWDHVDHLVTLLADLPVTFPAKKLRKVLLAHGAQLGLSVAHGADP